MADVTTSPMAARNTSLLRRDLDRRLVSYAAAACAAGVGMVPLAQPAKADIVYTPANQQLGTEMSLPIDLNNNGVFEFGLHNEVSSTTAGRLNNVFAYGRAKGDGVFLEKLNFAAALRAGARIGTGDPFSLVGFMATRWKTSYKGGAGTAGYWANVTDRYLGLEFEIDGQEHYGWARLNVTNGPGISIDTVLTGYAYNTVAGQPILAGQGSVPEPGTLGLLALGSLGLGFWRRKRSKQPSAKGRAELEG